MFVNNIHSFVKMIYRIKLSSLADNIVMQSFRNILYFLTESGAGFAPLLNFVTELRSVHQSLLMSFHHCVLPVRFKLAFEPD